ncbi:hypothetical protein [Segetibacter koreensis]|uniref:hypothetical protein n=1 Tax=Segetibacter koreensis TaxID=398037 RepID=UPI0003A11F25|nr:hypothetical protein [Segetibacter koreensis]
MKISFLSFCLVASSLFLFTQCTKDNSSPSTSTSNYSPLTVGSNWTYNYTQDSSAASTYTVTVTSKDTTANGRTYKVLSSSDGTGNLYMAREDSNYYRYASFPQLGIDGFEELYLKDNRPVNSTWTNTASFKYQGTSIPATLTYTIKEKGITHTVNGKTYNDVIHVNLDINVLISSIGGGDFYYAQGIGLIDNQISVGLSGASFNSKQELISYEIK